MTNEIIDKYLDQQGITPGEWKADYDEYDDIVNCSVAVACAISNRKDTRVLKNSRKSLRDWIMIAYWPRGLLIYDIFKLAVENIEASLEKPWSQVQEELERMER